MRGYPIVGNIELITNTCRDRRKSSSHLAREVVTLAVPSTTAAARDRHLPTPGISGLPELLHLVMQLRVDDWFSRLRGLPVRPAA